MNIKHPRRLDSEVRTANEACAQNEAIHKDKDVEGTFNPGIVDLQGSKPPLPGKRAEVRLAKTNPIFWSKDSGIYLIWRYIIRLFRGWGFPCIGLIQTVCQ